MDQRAAWCLLLGVAIAAAAAAAAPPAAILVVGSLNLDVIIPVHRLPASGETLVASKPAASHALGGKGANQAAAAALMAAGTRPVRFVTLFGNDSHARELEAELQARGLPACPMLLALDPPPSRQSRGVDISGSGRAAMPSGQGVVLLEPDGTATSVVLGGSNTAWPKQDAASLAHLVAGTGVVLLQQEVPEHVNEAVAAAAAAAGVPVLLDVGGEERPISAALMRHIDYLAPNESELRRLTGMPADTDEQVIAAARALIGKGAKHVLATLGHRGALLVFADGTVLRQDALPVPGGRVVDATAAGDAARAAFAVGLVEGRGLQDCLGLAMAAGAVAVSRLGAAPSLPSRAEAEAVSGFPGAGQQEQEQEQEQQAQEQEQDEGGAVRRPAPGFCSADEEGGSGGGSAEQQHAAAAAAAGAAAAEPAALACPYRFAARLNSMAARRDLATSADGGNDVLGWIRRQSRVKGLGLVDLNHPQHTAAAGLGAEALRSALAAANLSAGGVNIRYPADPYAHGGALANPDAAIRAQAVALAAEGCGVAAALGARNLIVWDQWSGYDYHLQADHLASWRHMVDSLRALADTCPPGVRVSLEPKPTDAATRWSVVPSTGTALLLVREVDRPNFGLTLDYGHLLAAGENPAACIALAASAGKLFGLHLNDGYTRAGAEDGLAFASVSEAAALEAVRWLQRLRWDGYVYFDTFPLKEDPVWEAEHNIRRFQALWARAARLAAAGLDELAARQDAMEVLELLEADAAGRLATGRGSAAATESGLAADTAE